MPEYVGKEKILRKIKGLGVKRVFVQFPEGLKLCIQDLVDFLEKNGLEVFLCIEECFGSCDLRDLEAKKLGCDLILHIGHSDFGLGTKLPVIYEEYFIDVDFIKFLKPALVQLRPYKKICLVSTIQFVKNLGKAKEFLEKNGKGVFLGVPDRSKHKGQLLGCDYSAAIPFDGLVDCFLFLGSGRFHPLGLQERVKKPVLFLDVERRCLENLLKEKNKIEIRKQLRVQKARELKNFGVIVSTKLGQFHLKTAERIKRKLGKLGKKSYILVADLITPEKLTGLKIDVLVNTACPRISEDYKMFKKVILSPEDVEKL